MCMWPVSHILFTKSLLANTKGPFKTRPIVSGKTIFNVVNYINCHLFKAFIFHFLNTFFCKSILFTQKDLITFQKDAEISRNKPFCILLKKKINYYNLMITADIDRHLRLFARFLSMLHFLLQEYVEVLEQENCHSKNSCGGITMGTASLGRASGSLSSDFEWLSTQELGKIDGEKWKALFL